MAVRQRIAEGRNPLLELCPFCGEPAEIYCVDGESGCRVRCTSDDCPFRPDAKIAFPTEDLAVKAWNTRKGGTSSPSDWKTLREALTKDCEDGFDI